MVFSPSLSSGVCTRKFFSPLLPEYRRGEANFATARELAESLARFGPPGFRLGTPSPGLAPGGSVISQVLIVLAADQGSAVCNFPGELEPWRRDRSRLQIMHKRP